MCEDGSKESPYGPIPKDWEFQPLAAVLGVVMDYRGRTPTKLGMEWGGGEIPALSAKNVCMGRIDLSRETYLSSDALYSRWMTAGDPERGDIIITLEAPLGNVARIPDERKYILSQRVVLLRPKPSMADKAYLAYQLMSEHFQAALVRNSTGTTATGIQRAKLETISILIPGSLSEQHRVGIAIDTINEAITKTEAVIAKLKQVRAGLLHDLLTHGLDQDGQLRDPMAHPEQFQDSPFGRIPLEWEIVRVGNETDIEHGFAFDGRLFSDKPLGPRLLVPGNFHRDGGLYFTDANTKYFAGDYPPNTVLANGDILIVMTDLSPMTLILGRTVLLNEPFEVLHNQRIGKFRFKQPGTWNPEFFVALMNHDRLRRKVMLEATGTTVRHTSPDRIKSGIGLKPPREEQDRVILIVRSVNSYLRESATELSKLVALKSGLMTDLLTGRVRVPELEDGRRCG